MRWEQRYQSPALCSQMRGESRRVLSFSNGMMSMPDNTSQTLADIIRQFLPTSPYVGHLGIQLTNMQPDVATLTLPFADSLITIGTTIHGGAIAS